MARSRLLNIWTFLVIARNLNRQDAKEGSKEARKVGGGGTERRMSAEDLFPTKFETGAPGLWGTNAGVRAACDPRNFRCDSMLRLLGSSFMRRIFNLTMLSVVISPLSVVSGQLAA